MITAVVTDKETGNRYCIIGLSDACMRALADGKPLTFDAVEMGPVAKVQIIAPGGNELEIAHKLHLPTTEV